jgi:hypothetical protein
MRPQPRLAIILAPLFALVAACDKSAPPAVEAAPPSVASAAATAPAAKTSETRRPRAEPEPAADPGLNGTEAAPRPPAPAEAEVAPAADAAAPAQPEVTAPAAQVPPETTPAPADVTPAFPALGLAACDRYIRAAEGCLGRVPDSQRATQRAAFDKLVASWKRQLETQGAAVEPALELGCKAAFEQARESFGTLCPDYVWR